MRIVEQFRQTQEVAAAKAAGGGGGNVFRGKYGNATVAIKTITSQLAGQSQEELENELNNSLKQ